MDEQSNHVTIRVRLANIEVEVTGPQEFVERKVSELIEKASSTHGSGTQESRSRSVSATGASPTPKATSPAQFFKTTGAKSDVARALAAGYFLEKVSNAESFTAAEVRDLVKAAKLPPPANPSDVIGQNIRKGLMMASGDKDGKMAYVLTADGEESIEDLLKSNVE